MNIVLSRQKYNYSSQFKKHKSINMLKQTLKKKVTKYVFIVLSNVYI